MDGTLKLTSSVQAYADLGSTSNPLKRYVDWAIQRQYPVKNPKADPYTVDPGATLALFSGVRSTSADATTQLQLTASPLGGSLYRMTWPLVGTRPNFRVDRAVGLGGRTVTVTVNNNLTAQMQSSSGVFSSVQVGDNIIIPDTSTGDAASPFNPLNTGYWVVLAKDGTSTILQVGRPNGVAFSAASETVGVITDDQCVVYSAAGVQVGDKVVVGPGFPSTVQATYQVTAVTPTWFEFVATAALPAPVTATGGSVAAVLFYSNAKRYIRCEFDQRCSIQINGGAGQTVEPWAAGDPDNTGFFESVGPVWSATVVNLSPAFPLNFLLISAE